MTTSDQWAGDDSMEYDHDAVEHVIETWADSEGTETLERWLMDSFGWTFEQAEAAIERYKTDA